MGILKAILTQKTRKMKEYSFIGLSDDLNSPYVAQEFKKFLDSTNFFAWNSDKLHWHTFDQISGKREVSFSAKFVKRDEEGNKIFLETGKGDNGNKMFFYFTVIQSNGSVWISVKGDNDHTFFTVVVLFEKK